MNNTEENKPKEEENNQNTTIFPNQEGVPNRQEQKETPPDFSTIFGMPSEEPQIPEEPESKSPTPVEIAPRESIVEIPRENTSSISQENIPKTSQEMVEISNPTNHPNTQESPIIPPINTNQTDVVEEELQKAFIGPNYEKITKNPFNIAGFFFTTFYMFYRKMFGYGILVFLLSLIVLNLIKNPIVTFAFNLIIGLFVNQLYISYANKKITQIKNQNQDKEQNEWKRICTEKGGTSIGTMLVGFILEIGITFLLIFLMLALGMTNAFGKTIFGFIKQEQQSTNETNSTYDGIILTNIDVNIEEEVTLTVPSKFKNNSNEYSYEYEYTYGEEIFNACKFTLYVPSGYVDADNLIAQMSSYEGTTNASSVSKTTINNLDWYWFYTDDSYNKVYYYGTTKDKKVLLIKYQIGRDVSSDCETYREEIVNSIKPKE